MKLGICVPHYGWPIEVERILCVVRRAEERGLVAREVRPALRC